MWGAAKLPPCNECPTPTYRRVRADLLLAGVRRALRWPEGAIAATLCDGTGAGRTGRMRAVVQAWPSAEVAIVVPMARARAMFERARRFDLTAGGRFDARGAAVPLWSTSDESESGEPVGCFYVKWHEPSEEQATIRRLEWDPAQGGSEAEVRRAIAVLGGAPA